MSIEDGPFAHIPKEIHVDLSPIDYDFHFGLDGDVSGTLSPATQEELQLAFRPEPYDWVKMEDEPDAVEARHKELIRDISESFPSLLNGNVVSSIPITTSQVNIRFADIPKEQFEDQPSDM